MNLLDIPAKNCPDCNRAMAAVVNKDGCYYLCGYCEATWTPVDSIRYTSVVIEKEWPDHNDNFQA